MIKKVAIYVRSSKDRKDVSCKAQEEELRKTVIDSGEHLYRVFTDKKRSSTRDPRPAFEEMIQLAVSKNPPFQKIYCFDTSRFGRDHSESQVILYKLRKKHGIEVVFTNMPNTGSYLDPAFEAIIQSFDFIHSQQSKVKGVAGMKQNVKGGYRAGGSAPYGYMLEYFEVGKENSGKPITKTKLTPNPETAPYAREYFERRAKYESRKSILRDFYRRCIVSPTGRSEWSVATAKSMEDNIDVYLGHTVFNRHNERLKEKGHSSGYLHGKKFKPRDEWEIKENTHEPLVSEETAKIIRSLKEKGIREPSDRAKKCYALSGVLKCTECGSNYTGNSGMYSCSRKTRPGQKCLNNDISQANVEKMIFSFIGNRVLNFKNLKSVIDRVKTKSKKGGPDLSQFDKNLKSLVARKQRLIDLYKNGMAEIDEIKPEVDEIKRHMDAIEKEKTRLGLQSDVVEVSDEEIRASIEQFAERVENADPETRKRAVQTLFEEIRISPKAGRPWERNIEIKGVCLPLTGVNVASPRGFEPLSPA